MQTWYYFAFNPNNSTTIYAAIQITGTSADGSSSFTVTTPVFTLGYCSEGGHHLHCNGSPFAFGSVSYTFTGATAGQEYTFTAVILWGTTSTTNPAALPFVGPHSISGSFEIEQSHHHCDYD
jgi:hypothetical protein